MPEIRIPTPNARFQHLFVVVRVDDVASSGGEVEDRISLVSAYTEEDEAHHEAERLGSTSLTGSRYIVMVTRLKPTAAPR